jgi:hypothetical protein
MKKYLSLFLIFCFMCLSAAGCSDHASSSLVSGNQSDSKKNSSSDNGNNQKPIGDFIDLTKMSSTMTYAEVYNMVTNPNAYIGKTVKMSGPYYVSYFDKTGKYYHAVIIQDATACCQSGLEFVWTGEHKYPDDYPKENTKIEVTGVFGTYDEIGRTYCYLTVDDITVLN